MVTRPPRSGGRKDEATAAETNSTAKTSTRAGLPVLSVRSKATVFGVWLMSWFHAYT